MKTSKARRPKRANGKKADIYEEVTSRILAQLEQDIVPWRTPHFAKVGFPRNFQSTNDYQGINILLLGMSGYLSPWFMTFLQAKEKGGTVRKGEKGSLVVKYGEYQRKDSKSGKEEDEVRRYLKGYHVFNASQIDGIEFPTIAQPEFTPSERVAKAKAIVSAIPNPPQIKEGEFARTFYDVTNDLVCIPHRSFFENEERFYQSLFHELVHATGAAKRLARKSLLKDKGGPLAKEKLYAKEELVAEMGASFLTAHAGITLENHEQNAAYIASWLKALKSSQNKRLVVEAASEAQKATSWLLGKTPQS